MRLNIVNRNKKGFTLVEVMIALLVLLFVSLAMMQTALVSIDSNMANVLRDEAVRIGEMRMADARNLPFSSLSNDGTDPNLTAAICPTLQFIQKFGTNGVRIETPVRGISGSSGNGFDFCTNRTVTPLSADDTQIVVTVGWIWKGQPYIHTVTNLVSQ